MREECGAQGGLGHPHLVHFLAEQRHEVERWCCQRAVKARKPVEESLGRRFSPSDRILWRDGRAGAQVVEDRAEMRRVTIDEEGTVSAALRGVPPREHRLHHATLVLDERRA